MRPAQAAPLPEGIVVFVKRDCPTCQLVAPVLERLATRAVLTVFSQDDPEFPRGVEVRDDTSLRMSWHHDVETVPTLLRVENGLEAQRAVGWQRGEWAKF